MLNDRTRVLFVIPSLGMGGSERVMTTLLRHINCTAFEPHLAVLNASGALIADVPADVPLHSFGITRARNAVFAVAGLCRKLKPQVLLSMSAHMNTAVVAARGLMQPRVSVVLREGADLYAREHNHSRARLFVYRHVYRHADMVICQSDFMRAELVMRFGLVPENARRIYNPVDIAAISAVTAGAPNPLAPGKFHIVSVGRFSHEKGYDQLLYAMRDLRETVPTVQLTLVGGGPDEPALRLLGRELGLQSCLQFAGVQRNPYSFVKHADLFVLPSRTEALPNVVLEALALGTPVVASDCTPALQEIRSYTRLLHVAEHPGAVGLAAMLRYAITTGTHRLPQPERAFEAQFGVDAVVRQYESACLEAAHAGDELLSRVS